MPTAAPVYRVESTILASGVTSCVGKPTPNLAAAIKRARAATEGGMLHGPENETRVLDERGVLHRFRKLTHGRLTASGGSFRARPCEVDENGRPGTTVRLLGMAAGPEVGDAFVRDMLGRS